MQKLFLLSGICLLAIPAYAAENVPSKVKVSGSVRFQATGDENMDLGTANEDFTDNESIEGKIRIKADLTDNVTFFNENRGVLNYGESGGEDPETGESLGQDNFLEMRQLWVEYRGLFGQEPLSTKVGRQRFVEPYGLWWNRDFDAVRLAYDTTLFKGFIAAGENLSSYKTSDHDLLEQDEDIARVMAEGSWQWKMGQYIETRLAYQDDHSGLKEPGTIISSDQDSEDARLLWGGVRLKGEGPSIFKDTGKISYRVDLLGVAGEEDEQLSSRGPGTSRTVTGSADRDVRGWAFDAGMDIPLPVMGKPSLMLDYAYGSGDDDSEDGTDHSFRQTGLDSNTSLYGNASSAINHYGFLLRPDLSNIHIFSLGAMFPVFKSSDLTMIYHYYRLADEATELRTSGVDADLNGNDKDLGHEFDVMLSVNLTKEANFPDKHIRQIDWRTTAGAFRAGEAYGDGKDEVAGRIRTELVFRF